MKAMKTIKKTMIALLAAATFAGCRVVEVEHRGDGQGWRVYHNQHWMATRADTITATVRPDGTIRFALGGLNTEPSEELAKLVEASLKGATALAAKVAAAIATSGGTAAGDALADAIGDYLARGGDASKARVSCSDGLCTISDGTVSESLAVKDER